MQDRHNQLWLIDLDGTLLRGNSLPLYLIHAVGWKGLFLGLPGWVVRCLGLLFRGNVSKAAFKEALLGQYLSGKSRTDLERAGEACARQLLMPRLHPDVNSRVQEAAASGNTIVVVTASLDIWVKPLARELNVSFVCTEALFDVNGCFTGRFATPNCKYGEKKRRILEKYAINRFDRVVVYGNSRGDEAMAELADEVWWVKKNGALVCRKHTE